MGRAPTMTDVAGVVARRRAQLNSRSLATRPACDSMLSAASSMLSLATLVSGRLLALALARRTTVILPEEDIISILPSVCE